MLALRVATLNIHKGWSQFNRRMVIHEIRDGLRDLAADIAFLQEVQGSHERHALRHKRWPATSQHEFIAEGDWQPIYACNATYGHGHHGNAILSRFPLRLIANYDVSNNRYERRGLLHCEATLPGTEKHVHLVCVHLSLREQDRERQLQTLIGHLSELIPLHVPLIVAGDFNDWRHLAGRALLQLELQEVVTIASGRPARTYPSILPILRLDRIYVRGFQVNAARVHHGKPWSFLSDHLAVTADVVLNDKN